MPFARFDVRAAERRSLCSHAERGNKEADGTRSAPVLLLLLELHRFGWLDRHRAIQTRPQEQVGVFDLGPDFGLAADGVDLGADEDHFAGELRFAGSLDDVTRHGDNDSAPLRLNSGSRGRTAATVGFYRACARSEEQRFGEGDRVSSLRRGEQCFRVHGLRRRPSGRAVG